MFPKLTFEEGRKPYNGVNRISTYYHIQCDTYLIVGVFYKLIIPCACIECSSAMDLPWYTYILHKDHRIYSSVTKCKYYPIRGKHNDRVIIGFIDKGTDKEEYKSVHNILLQKIKQHR